MEKVRKQNRTTLNEDCLRWTPLVHTNLALIEDGDKLVNGVDGFGCRNRASATDSELDVDIVNENNVKERPQENGIVVNGDVNMADDEEHEEDEGEEEETIVRPRKRTRSVALSEAGSDDSVADENQAKPEEDNDGDAKEPEDEEKEPGEIEPKKTRTSNEASSSEDGSGSEDDSESGDDSSSSSSSSFASSSSSSEESDKSNRNPNKNPSTENPLNRGTDSSSLNNPALNYSSTGYQPHAASLDFKVMDPYMMDSTFSNLSSLNTSVNLDQDLNTMDFPDTDSSALIKELSEEVFSIGAPCGNRSPSISGQRLSDEEDA